VSSDWVAFLRGINVGGHNRLAMADLRTTLASIGCDDVMTLLQSGNAVFAHDGPRESDLGEQIRAAMRRRHGLDVPVVLRSADDIALIAGRHPDLGGGIDPKLLHILILDRAPDEVVVARLDLARFAPDRALVDGSEIYITYPDGSGRSKLTIDVFERSLGVVATARNVNTMAKLAGVIASR